MQWPNFKFPAVNLWSVPKSKTSNIYMHKHTHNYYLKLFEGMMRVNDLWITSVTYQSVETGEKYTRCADEFESKFKRV
jgi:hypothetical protein